ncbi:MAG: ATP-dependent DNA helicase RecG, partial [Rickettsiales bacterium]|nr:ATP-dependent DNA helicase RecG [Rickettsiales bacterium]
MKTIVSRPEYLNFLFASVDNLKGVGKKSLECYSRLLNKKRKLSVLSDLPRMLDLLYHLPERTIIRKRVISTTEIKEGDYIIAKLNVINHVLPPTPKSPYKILCHLADRFVYVIYYKFYQNWLETKFPIGRDVIVSGKVEFYDTQIQIIQPDYIDNYGNMVIPEIEPVYPLTFGVVNKDIRGNIATILQNTPDLKEWLPDDILRINDWVSWKNSLLGLHTPNTDIDMKNNKFLKRLVFDEFLAYQLSLMIVKKITSKGVAKEILKNTDSVIKNIFIKKLGFELTDDQKQAIKEIEKDTFSQTKMNRLLQGDVGSGKTIVAFLCGLNYVENQKQVVFMVPTLILAAQHYDNMQKLCKDENINVELLAGKMKISKKRQILQDLKSGKTNILIGTHTLIEENIEFDKLGFVVIDEQQRFGVEQRMMLINKDKNVDILSMSATPIPRTLALTIYSDMDLTVIRQKPVNRRDVKTSLVSMDRYDNLLESMRKKFQVNEKIFWVCPLIEESEKIDLQNVKSRYEEFCKFFGEDRVGFVHGKMDNKDKIMEDFVNDKQKKILISTTAIEVGVDVPEATIMVIEHPERFGLSQLHQLRGRVGRNDKESFCILLCDQKNIGVRGFKRLGVMKETNDGFRIAEEDLKLRGIGEILGVKQSGNTDFIIADLDRDMELLTKANILARKVI